MNGFFSPLVNSYLEWDTIIAYMKFRAYKIAFCLLLHIFLSEINFSSKKGSLYGLYNTESAL